MYTATVYRFISISS